MIPLLDLSIVLLIFLFVELYVLKVSFSSPSFIFTASFTICAFSTLFISESWQFYNLSPETFNVIIISVLIFVLIEEFIRLVSSFTFSKRLQGKIEVISFGGIRLNNKYLYFAIFLSLVGLVWTSYYIIGYIRSGDWVRMMADYKDTVNQDSSSFGLGKTLLNQIMKISTVINYILLFLYNLNTTKGILKKDQKRLYLLSFIMFMLFRFFLSGGRQGVFFFLVAWLTCYYILQTFCASRIKKQKVNFQYIKIFVILVLVVLPLFYFMGRAAGRKEHDFILEAAFGYLSSGIYGLEQIVSHHYESHYWGEVSFPNLYSLFKFFEIIPQNLKDVAFLPFFHHGNTVSIIGRWYWDFGPVGVYIMTSFTSVFYSLLYYYGIYHATNIRNRNISIIIYSILIYSLYFAGYDDFIMAIISLNYLLIIIFIVLFYVLFVPSKKLRKKVIYLAA